MASAVCPVCELVVRIESRGWKKDDTGRPVRQLWETQPHTALGDDSGGRQCDGSRRFV